MAAKQVLLLVVFAMMGYTQAITYCGLMGHECQAGTSCSTGSLVTSVLSLCPPQSVCCDVPPEVDECTLNTHNCHSSAVCTNNVGSFTCTCISGYSGDGVTCTDQDECAGANSCHVNANCVNQPGSYYCTCATGYNGNGFSCSDIDECTTGSYSCSASSMCINTQGSYTCSCNTGYTWNGATCVDIDECSTGANNCDIHAICSNLQGSYTCVCPSGFTGNGVTCYDIHECNENIDNCAGSATCTNTIGSYYCTCPTGYTFDGSTCVDEDECATGSHTCGTPDACSNTAGYFLCVCPPGYYGDGTQCTEYPCGVVGPLSRVSNGDNAAACAWPWQLSIRRNLAAPSPPDLLTSTHECAGTLISPYWVLTTPECILYSAKYDYSYDPAVDAFVVAGENNVNIDEGVEQILRIGSIHIHPDYPNVNTYEELTDYFGEFSDISKQSNSFALIKLSTPADYNNCVKHICLPAQNETSCETFCAVTGWGYDKNYAYPNTLQEAYMKVFTPATCKAFEFAIKNIAVNPPEKTVCSANTDGVWPCLGDDGGPVSCFRDSHYVLGGIYSYPDNCGDEINGVTYLSLGDVAQVVTWIQTTMASN